MSLHIHGAIVTHNGVGSNNRGENEGNITTLQKLLWNEEVHTTVSAEAIRWAVRYRWQTKGLNVRRVWDDQHENYGRWDAAHEKCIEQIDFDAEKYIDDDLMGFMRAEAAKAEVGAEEGGAKKKRGKGEPAPKNPIDKRRGVLEVARAVSLTPYAGDVTFNAKAGEKNKTSLYATEVHATRYQYGFSLTPERLQGPKQERAAEAVEALVNLGEVAGNHSRFLYDFSPESVALRITQDPSPRFLYCFEDQGGQISAAKLVRAVRCGDIAPGELIVGGALADTKDGAELKKLGVAVFEGVREAGRVAVERIRGGKP